MDECKPLVNGVAGYYQEEIYCGPISCLIGGIIYTQTRAQGALSTLQLTIYLHG